MIRQLRQSCWYFDCDPWEEPHFATDAAARAFEAEAAADDERERRPMLQLAEGCWFADCDRCERPLADDDGAFERLHCRTRAELLGCLDATKWRAMSGGSVCCPGCVLARPPLAVVERVAVTVRAGGSVREAVGERTACPQLVITPDRGASPEDADEWLGMVLTHLPTGRCLPLRAWTCDVGVLHRVAELLASLDWSSTDPVAYAEGYAGPVIAAVDQAIGEHISVNSVSVPAKSGSSGEWWS